MMEAGPMEAAVEVARAEAATAMEEGGMGMVALEAAAATEEVAMETGTERSTSRCWLCRNSCSRSFGATRSPQTCVC